MNMVEKVARAMQSSEAWSSFWSRDDALKLARAAIAAMREPSEAMVNAALHDHATNSPYETPFGPDGSFARQFNAMIDAALAEGGVE